jgi:hypothetical protein
LFGPNRERRRREKVEGGEGEGGRRREEKGEGGRRREKEGGEGRRREEKEEGDTFSLLAKKSL